MTFRNLQRAKSVIEAETCWAMFVTKHNHSSDETLF